MTLPMTSTNVGGRMLPSISVKNTNFRLDSSKIDISLSGGMIADIADSLVWIFQSIILSEVSKVINKELPPEIEKEINSLISDTQALAEIYGNLSLDLAYSSNPVISDTQMSLFFNSTFYNKMKGYSTPSTAIVDLQVDPSTKGNVQARVSTYTADSFMKVLYESGKITYTITQDIIPKNIPIILNTDVLDGLLPGLVAKYGRGKAVTIDLICKDSPVVFFNEGQMGGSAALDAVFKVGNEVAIILTFKGMQNFIEMQLKNSDLTVRVDKILI